MWLEGMVGGVEVGGGVGLSGWRSRRLEAWPGWRLEERLEAERAGDCGVCHIHKPAAKGHCKM